MRKGVLASLTALLAGAGLMRAEEPGAAPVAPPAAAAPAAPPAVAAPAAPAAAAAPVTLPSLPAEAVPHGAAVVLPFTPNLGVGHPGQEPCPNCAPEAAPRKGRCWVDADYLLWWFKKGPQPLPLVTTGQNPPLDFSSIGTSTVFGPNQWDYGAFSGGRVTIGGWLGEEGRVGFELRGFLLERRSADGFSINGDPTGNPQFAVPFFDLGLGRESSFLTSSLPRVGSFAINSSSRLWGAEANSLFKVSSCDNLTFALLGGFRYLDLSERQEMQLQRTATDFVPFLGVLNGPGSIISSADTFRARNQFYGGQIGGTAQFTCGKVYGSVTGKLAMGTTHQTIDVGGISGLRLADGTQSYGPGGLFAGPSKMGGFSENQFSFIPEGEVKVGCLLTNNIGLSVGYNFLYWTKVIRPGDQVNRNIDSREIATSFNFDPTVAVQRTPANFNRTDFWAQGVNFSLEFRY